MKINDAFGTEDELTSYATMGTRRSLPEELLPKGSTDKIPTVLIIDQDAIIRQQLRLPLEGRGYRVVEAAGGQQGLDEAAQCRPDAVLMEMTLPDMEGITMLKRFREWSRVPVLVVSACGQEAEKIRALDCGANDYVTKPFSVHELLARLGAARRFAPQLAEAPVFRSGRLSVDLASRTVKVSERKVRLTVTEYSILQFFVQNAGKVVTHEQILREVWHDELNRRGSLRVYLSFLRDKLESNPKRPELLITEPRMGYRLALQE